MRLATAMIVTTTLDHMKVVVLYVLRTTLSGASSLKMILGADVCMKMSCLS